MNQLAYNKIETHDLAQAVRSTCPYCGVGCGVLISSDDTGWHVQGDPDHPANRGQLCVKGTNLMQTLSMHTRLIEPLQGQAAARQPIGWTQAIDQIATRFQACIDQYGADSIAFYVSGQLLTEDYYVVNKFVKGALGTANIDTNSRLCMSSAVAAHKRAFGEDVVIGQYEDLEQADVVILVGSNTAWCHPVLFQRLMQAKAERPALQIVVVDPRYTSTCEQADLHVAVLPGQDVALFNGLFQYLYQHDVIDHNFVNQHTTGLDALLEATQAQANIIDVARQCGLSHQFLTHFYQLFAQHDKVVTLFSMGVNQSSQGTDKANSIINCHLLTGRLIGRGMGAFSMTGQPNAMGGREVGGLSNMLAAHLELENPQHQTLVQTFWQTSQIATQTGLKAVELFEAVEQGKIKALWIMATNPVVSLPNSDQVKRALDQCPFVVVSEVCQETDTTQYADLLLPAQAWGEKDGTVTNSERYISRQRQFLTCSPSIQPDWWAVAQVAQAMGYQGFDFNSSFDIFMEHARLSAYANVPSQRRTPSTVFRCFNLDGLTTLSSTQYDDLSPIQWPVYSASESKVAYNGTSKPDASSINAAQFCHQPAKPYQDYRFTHHDEKARFIATYAQSPVYELTSEYPLILNTGRVRDQWHTMTRTGLSAHLALHRSQPYCEMHPLDALKYGIHKDDLVEVRSAWGRCIVRAHFIDTIRRGQVFVPIHWNDQNASDARVGALVNPVVDPISGEPEFKHTPVSIQPFYGRWHAVLFVAQDLAIRPEQLHHVFTWWVKIAAADATRIEVVGRLPVNSVLTALADLLPDAFDEDVEWLDYQDAQLDIVHLIVLRRGKLVAAFYLAPKDLLPQRDWIAPLFTRQRLSALHRRSLLAGVPMTSVAYEGPIVCSCFKVGQHRIVDAIKLHQWTDEKQVTACLKAGGNCGSCLPEIRGLIRQCQIQN